MKKSMVVFIFLAFNFINPVFSADAREDTVKLLLPPAVYASPGYEMNIYFDNIILVPDIRQYNFNISVPDKEHGVQYAECWRFVPSDKSVGSFPWKIKVLNGQNKVAAEGETTVHVSPKDAGAGRQVSVLMIGDSLTAASAYPNELKRLFSMPGNPEVKFIGTLNRKGAAHEGRGGWTWAGYCNLWTEGGDFKNQSPFLYPDGEKRMLNFKKYIEDNNEGKAPDFVTVFLGCNDIFFAGEYTQKTQSPESIARNVIFKYSDKFIDEIRRTCPETQIGLILPVPPCATQDGFVNYKCSQTRWQYRINQHTLTEEMIKKYGNREKENIFLVPAYLNIDCVNGFPSEGKEPNAHAKTKILRHSNGVHPAQSGYLQIADSIYAWLKYRLSCENKNK
ncbi:MAG: hypothetical protein A2017_13440 [Lentisphaerae bacterium GWF2_44_16]|nr:MAG: hypothetical protein A2017_13440 [Lentisphaerae bacterium GWF2_44_16]